MVHIGGRKRRREGMGVFGFVYFVMPNTGCGAIIFSR
jgi:hypothetical protein